LADKDQFDFGERVQSFVDDAVDSLNFENLNSNIQKTINSAFDSSAGGGVQYHYGGDRAADQKSVYRRLMAQNPPESLSGALERVIGLACLLLFGVTGGICFAIPIISAGIICMALADGGAYLFKRGRDKKQRVEHFRVFRRIIGNKNYCSVQDLADAVGLPKEKVAAELRIMLQKGYFPYGRLDEQGTCLMLDETAYEAYLAAQQSMYERQQQQREQAREEEKVRSASDVDKAIYEGEKYIEEIRKANDNIPGEEMSAKLDTMVSLVRRILDRLKEQPDQLPRLRKFNKYYMPTTLKLVKAYEDLDQQPVDGENIRKSKEEIEKTIDTINIAYEKLLDSLFQDSAIDISSDISVLESMLAQEGLTEDKFTTTRGN